MKKLPFATALVGGVVSAIVTCSSIPLAGAVGRPSEPSHATRVAHSVKVPHSPVGTQLNWLLGIAPLLPLSAKEESAHFDATFVREEPVAKLNAALESLGSSGSTLTLLGISKATSSTLVAELQIGSVKYSVQLSVDPQGLVDGLFFSLAAPLPVPKVDSWSQIATDLSATAPDVSFLAAKLNANGTCSDEHEVHANTPRPLGSMFKLFILGALARDVKDGSIHWNQTLTLTNADKVSGSGILQNDPSGTTLSVEQAAVDMISVSDNTAADMLLALVGRGAVEDQVRAWSTHSALDDPFLTVAELFVLKWHDYPTLANKFLSMTPSQRASFLASTVDKIPDSALRTTNNPRDVNSIEWFASPEDICHAWSGLLDLASNPALTALNTILSTNDGGLSLSPTTWKRVWFKGGSEPGVLTLSYLARDAAGQNYVVVVMWENPTRPLASSAALLGLGIVKGAFTLLHADSP